MKLNLVLACLLMFFSGTAWADYADTDDGPTQEENVCADLSSKARTCQTPCNKLEKFTPDKVNKHLATCRDGFDSNKLEECYDYLEGNCAAFNNCYCGAKKEEENPEDDGCGCAIGHNADGAGLMVLMLAIGLSALVYSRRVK